jgi:hypothetical protein
MDHPALNRILKQVNHNRESLENPDETAESRMSSSDPDPPLQDVSNFFSEEELEERDALNKSVEEAEKRNLKILAGEIPPEEEPIPEPELTKEDLPPEVQEYLDEEKEEFSFESCYDLRDFFAMNRDKFDDWQHPAIDSVKSAVESITNGCKCKLEQRRKMVENYYVQFVEQNKDTALMPKMKEILKTEKIIFASEGKAFLEL